MSNAPLDRFDDLSTAPMSRLITILPPGRWCAKRTSPEKDDDDARSTADSEHYGSFEVCSPRDFVHALSVVLLSGHVHDDVEICCRQPGMFSYVQCALVWFAGATGPFRSRAVTVFTPDCDEFDGGWTRALPAYLDVLRTNALDYLLSVDNGPRPVLPELDVFLDNSLNVVRVRNAPGNIVLHTGSSLPSTSDNGVHVAAAFPLDATARGRCVMLANARSLRDYCRLREIPQGVRGPDVWKVFAPWSRKDPSAFCLVATRLKFRWESGNVDWSEAPLQRDDDRDRQCTRNASASRNRCAKDNKLVAEDARFWTSVDASESHKLSAGADAWDVSTAGSHDVLRVECSWHESGRGASLVLNGRLELRFVYDKPGACSHEFFEPAQKPDCRVDGRGVVTRHYKPAAYKNIVHDVYAMSLYGCGIAPVFTCVTKTEPKASCVVRLVFGTLAVADRLPGALGRPCNQRIVLYFREGHASPVRFARSMVDATVVALPAGGDERPTVFAFVCPRELFADQPTLAASLPQPFRPHAYVNPTRFLSSVGSHVFTLAVKRYPELTRRADVRDPVTARDPRWLGVALCVAEWKGDRELADKLVPGCLESLAT